MDVGELCGLLVGSRESKTSRGYVAAQYFLESRFVERNLPSFEHSELVRINIHPENLVTQLGHASCVCRPEVACAEYRNTRSHNDVCLSKSSLRRIML